MVYSRVSLFGAVESALASGATLLITTSLSCTAKKATTVPARASNQRALQCTHSFQQIMHVVFSSRHANKGETLFCYMHSWQVSAMLHSVQLSLFLTFADKFGSEIQVFAALQISIIVQPGLALFGTGQISHPKVTGPLQMMHSSTAFLKCIHQLHSSPLHSHLGMFCLLTSWKPALW